MSAPNFLGDHSASQRVIMRRQEHDGLAVPDARVHPDETVFSPAGQRKARQRTTRGLPSVGGSARNAGDRRSSQVPATESTRPCTRSSDGLHTVDRHITVAVFLTDLMLADARDFSLTQ